MAELEIGRGSTGRSWQRWDNIKRCWQGQCDPLSTQLLSPQVAAVLTLPFDVVKTQRQIELGDSEVHPGEGVALSGCLRGTLWWHMDAPGSSPTPLSPQSNP